MIGEKQADKERALKVLKEIEHDAEGICLRLERLKSEINQCDKNFA